MSNISKKKTAILKYITKHFKKLDPTGHNIKRYTDMLTGMSDVEFDRFMHAMKKGENQFHIVLPNMTERPSMSDILEVADATGTELFHRIYQTDAATGKRFLSRHKYPVFDLPIRRLQQFLDKKLSVADGDSKIDGMTGQVTGDDRAAGITNPEIQAMLAKGLSKTLTEFVTVRGGNIGAYGDFKQHIEEHGSVRLDELEVTTKTRSVVVAQILLEGMHLQNNIAEG